jgi:type VII secretion-associated serine protease mycosin
VEPKKVRLRKFLVTSIAIALAMVSVFTITQPASSDAIRDREYWINDYGFNSAWKITKGSGVRVAVIDTGIDDSHPDLAGAIASGKDVSGIGGRTGNTPIGEISYHGTMVASLLAGRGHGNDSKNPAGVIGTAPEADLLSVSMAFGDAHLDTDRQIAEGIHWAVDNGAQVINLSLTRNSSDWPQTWDEAFLYAFDHDVVIVAAAGNRASGTDQIGAPATIPGVLVVAGVDKNAKASNQASTEGLTVSVSAPATDLVSAYPGSDYKIWSGTSGAAPIVSGLVALVRAKYPNLDANNVINRIIATATPQTNEKFSPIYGFGLINPMRALTEDVPKVSQNPLGSLAEWVQLYRKSPAEPDSSADGETQVSKIAGPIIQNQAEESSGFDATQIVPIGVYLIFGFLVLRSVARGLRRRK